MAGEKAAGRKTAVGALLALVTAALMATQDPLSGPAAKALGGAKFIMVTQFALLAATPFLLWERQARRDFVAIFSHSRDRWRLVALTALGLCGLGLYSLCLSGAHPVVITAILNLSPFWAALAAWLILRIRPPVRLGVFAAALAGAFAGGVIVALSQSGASGGLFKGTWVFAIPVPFFTALSATLLGVWFKDYSQSAAVAAALFAPPLVLLPLGALYLAFQPNGFVFDWGPAALLVIGTILASALGRLTYQLALQATNGDNGFVTMFFLLAPALSGLYSWALSPFVKTLAFHPNALYFAGLAVTAASLLAFLHRAKAKSAT
jgi:drug/metabolite transporter (DMT)-like permease